MSHWVYILKSRVDNTYYKGVSNDVSRRLKEHNNKEEKATRGKAPWDLILALPKESRGEALILEKKLKNLSRDRLEAFIKKYGSSRRP